MKSVYFKQKWGGRDWIKVNDLASFLKPEDRHFSESGQLEDLKYQLDEARKVIGSLLAVMVEKEILTLEEAFKLTGLAIGYELRIDEDKE